MGEDYRYGRSKTEKSFKSKGEVQIARLLERNRIVYEYEHPTAVLDKEKVKIWYPDFHLPEYGIIIEYFGVNGKSSYDEQARHKIEVYKHNGIEGLFLTESSLKGDWPGNIISQIEGVLKGRLERFYGRCRAGAPR